jgi:hypothetical protein
LAVDASETLGNTVTERVVTVIWLRNGSEVYVDFPRAYDTLPAGKRWVKVDPKGDGRVAGRLVAPLVVPVAVEGMLEFVRTSGIVRGGARATVDGVPTTLYEGHTPEGSTIVVDVDRTGRIRQFVLTERREHALTPTSLTVKLSRFGAPVSIAPPPSGLVTAQ